MMKFKKCRLERDNNRKLGILNDSNIDYDE